jgi:hypothetical protein
MSVVNFVKNQKGGFNLQDSKGFLYRINRSCPAKDRTYWACVNRVRDSCTARVITVTSTKEIIQEADDHTHSNRLLERKVREVENDKIRAAALMPTVEPRSVLGEIAVNLETNLPGTVSFMAHRQTINRRIHRLRNNIKGFPPKPKTFDDLANLPEHLTMTSDMKNFVLLNDTVKQEKCPDAARIIVFMSDEGAEVLASCQSWFIDGTFKAASHTLFKQVVNRNRRFVVIRFVFVYVLSLYVLSSYTFCRYTFCRFIRFVPVFRLSSLLA